MSERTSANNTVPPVESRIVDDGQGRRAYDVLHVLVVPGDELREALETADGAGACSSP